jgi:hypothetical protein
MRLDNISECSNRCLNQFDSVRIVYYEQNVSTVIPESTCFCKKNFDLYNSILKNEESQIFSVKSTWKFIKNEKNNDVLCNLVLTDEYLLSNLEQNNEFKIMLECIIPDGSEYKSETKIYRLSNNYCLK